MKHMTEYIILNIQMLNIEVNKFADITHCSWLQVCNQSFTVTIIYFCAIFQYGKQGRST